MGENLILAATFVAVLLVSTISLSFVVSRREISSRLAEAGGKLTESGLFVDQDLSGLSKRDSARIKHYFDVIRNDTNSDSLPNRLLRAGFFSPNSLSYFQIVRAGIGFGVSVLAYFLLQTYVPSASNVLALVIALMAGAFSFFIANIVLERMGVSKERQYRRLFPDYMDMMIVCVDAGLSIEAAADRVAREFSPTHPGFGIHLSIMMLEVRGGRRLREALANLADRLRIDEARTLAVLFRQSEELGSSVTKSLRVYSREMRQHRILKAEEKANALPIKMLFPLATFLFPMSLLIVLVPIVMRVVSMLTGLSPGG
ncbi:type II secretion system F family protein [Pseudaminobacter sp. 19-2017]|uniref:Type II secretion system F family protein n=1 Tax=Pseudaminobacter soli (ex Zhang et al. 2022) TaxID=2831468 RepID=A0A942DW57_9HYPH|nr:type II secretion system F family protein [Pseudaminobacter soli]MBS3648106.1 type II secretion system F family protein [Pseudaminobacter soli]